MNETLRAQMVEAVLAELRKLLSEKKVGVTGYPFMGVVRLSGLSEDVVKLFTALSY